MGPKPPRRISRQPSSPGAQPVEAIRFHPTHERACPSGRAFFAGAEPAFLGARAMQRLFRVSPPSVHQMVLTLERLGLVRRQPGVARSIEVLLAPEDLPVLRHPEPVKSSVPRN